MISERPRDAAVGTLSTCLFNRSNWVWISCQSLIFLALLIFDTTAFMPSQALSLADLTTRSPSSLESESETAAQRLVWTFFSCSLSEPEPESESELEPESSPAQKRDIFRYRVPRFSRIADLLVWPPEKTLTRARALDETR